MSLSKEPRFLTFDTAPFQDVPGPVNIVYDPASHNFVAGEPLIANNVATLDSDGKLAEGQGREAMRKIASVALTQSVSTLEIPNIVVPLNAKHLKLLMQINKNASAGGSYLYMRINNDISAASYNNGADGAAAAALISEVAAANTAFLDLTILNFANSNIAEKPILTIGAYAPTSAGVSSRVYTPATAGAVSSVQFFWGTGATINADSYVDIYSIF